MRFGSTRRATTLSAFAIGTAALAALPLTTAIDATTFAVLDDHDSMFVRGLLSPAFLLLPLVASLIACTEFSAEVAHRHTSAIRMRTSLGRYLTSRYLLAGALGFSTFFAYSFITFIVAFYVWPALGDPGIVGRAEGADPSGRHAFSPLLVYGDFAYGVGYSAWAGFCGAVYTALGSTALLVVRNRLLALALPFLVFIGQSIAATVLWDARMALQFSLIPFGLTAAPIGVTMLPHLVLAAVVAVVAVVAVRRIPASGRLS